MYAGCYLHVLTENLAQNVYNGKFLMQVMKLIGNKNCNLMCASCYLNVLTENPAQNVYNGKFLMQVMKLIGNKN